MVSLSFKQNPNLTSCLFKSLIQYLQKMWNERKRSTSKKMWKRTNSGSGCVSHLCLRRPLKSSSPASSCPSLLLLTRRNYYIKLDLQLLPTLENNAIRATQSKSSVDQWVSVKLTHDLCLQRNLCLVFVWIKTQNKVVCVALIKNSPSQNCHNVSEMLKQHYWIAAL